MKTFLLSLVIVLLASITVKAAQHSLSKCEAQAMNQEQVRECINF